MTLTGQSFIANSRGAGTESCGSGINPATGAALAPATILATTTETQQALDLAAAAAVCYRNKTGLEKATFLRQIASNIEAAIEQIVEVGPQETALPEMRMRGETGRTVGQLRMFAQMVEDGSWVDARIELAQPDRAPIPKVDLRSMLRPIGPVAVFTASNFPLAFSVAGGDTASALAAGCPVIVKAHSAHPSMSEIIAQCVVDAANTTGMPEGVFSMLYGKGSELGQQLVKAPEIKAVGFTGSTRGGRSLMDSAAARPEPIPVYAEMGSINPVVMMKSALGDKSESLAEAFFGSLAMGVGQFCTNPGLVFIPAEESAVFASKLAEHVAVGAPGVMLNPGICSSYLSGVDSLSAQDGVEQLAYNKANGCGQVGPAVLQTTGTNFAANEALQEEVFGPASLLVTYASCDELKLAIEALGGQLTASVHGSEEDFKEASCLISLLERKAGRVIFNGFPTGVEVCQSMVHGGPYPATSDGRSTSVGNMAIFRFARAVSYQSFPQAALPAELQDANPLGICQMVNGTSK